MDTKIVRELLEYSAKERAARPSALIALSLLPFRRLFKDAGIAAKIQEFVYTLT